jgi:hypothetical protein
MSETPNAGPPPAGNTPNPANHPPVSSGYAIYDVFPDDYEIPPHEPADTVVLERGERRSSSQAAVRGFTALQVPLSTRVLLLILAVCAGCLLTIALHSHPSPLTHLCQGSPARTPTTSGQHTTPPAAHPRPHTRHPTPKQTPIRYAPAAPIHTTYRPQAVTSTPQPAPPTPLEAPSRPAGSEGQTKGGPFSP